ncbi:unnamed protein product [Rhizophagus irregularis]|uniref:Methyltransferase domain-containing protein n=1 Tax=Rhizophagus irregularis TaxID=588596 RepID=A0A915ZIQ6_9GLOM|nr:unnamed protein product [Rhizophagus irregularis]GBC34191.1 S-adenosyl-L-methionine-dependent methyltransferase [Rhizophagus irregularis DAOM 181602=DAOM 197198]CAB4422188.1 unnamed protein product [Rhizophagus irregularis]CAB4422627.1 unnamed protein product [Rhizophagus irregularis]CAB5360042.1 unnamed protein product [Rhizophagus irregularis]
MGNSGSVNYLVKVDEVQVDRIQKLHHIIKSCFNNTNYSAPISKDLERGIEVLDIGSGPGTWIFDMSSDYKKSKFTGIEIESSIVPAILPFNTRFIYHNVLDGIPFYPNSFDYIFMRREVIFHNMGPISRRIFYSMEKILRNRSMNPLMCNRLHEFLAKHKLRHIQQEDVMIPLSPLNGKIGELHGLNAYYSLYGMKDVLAKHMRLSKWETERLIEGFLDETRTYQMYCKYTRVYGEIHSNSQQPIKKDR